MGAFGMSTAWRCQRMSLMRFGVYGRFDGLRSAQRYKAFPTLRHCNILQGLRFARLSLPPFTVGLFTYGFRLVFQHWTLGWVQGLT